MNYFVMYLKLSKHTTKLESLVIVIKTLLHEYICSINKIKKGIIQLVCTLIIEVFVHFNCS